MWFDINKTSHEGLPIKKVVALGSEKPSLLHIKNDVYELKNHDIL